MTSTSKNEIIEMLSVRDNDQKALFSQAVETRNAAAGNSIYFRGLIEFSNFCSNNCLYCGIRNDNTSVERYSLSLEDILLTAETIAKCGFRSLVLQSGEQNSKYFIDQICRTLTQIKEAHPEMTITLSVGEQKKETYREFFRAGAERYLLRIETSSRKLYEKMHPPEMSFDNRIKCLSLLRETGFQVGTGVMINLPDQSIEDLANDILFFKDIDIDMCGMGPYVPHSDAPLKHENYTKEEAIALSLNMISALRITMNDINIASTTALETISKRGKELGLLAGANVIMPQFSPQKNRKNYMLYDNKPLITSEGKVLIKELNSLAEKCSMKAAFDNPGNSLHYIKRRGIV